MSTQRKLTRAEKKQIEAAIARAKQQDKKKRSAQDSIPFERMWPDGICRVKPGYFTKTIQFQDINYQLNQNEDKTAIFEGWCDFLNYFDSSVKFQLSLRPFLLSAAPIIPQTRIMTMMFTEKKRTATKEPSITITGNSRFF